MYCPNCGKEIGDAKFCPECGFAVNGQPTPNTAPEIKEPPKKPKKKMGCLTAVLVFVVLIAVIGSMPSSDTPSSDTSSSEGSTQQKAADLEILDHSVTNDGYVRYVTGHIKNNTDKTYSYVQVEINLYEGDVQVGSTMDNINNLEPGGTWEFNAIIIDDNATDYKIAGVTGW